MYVTLTMLTLRPSGSVRGRLNSGDVAQLGEHRLCKPGVVGSSPIVSTGLPRLVQAGRGGQPAS